MRICNGLNTPTIENAKRKILTCQESRFILTTLGAIAGFFGTTEISALSMILWICLNSKEAWKKANRIIKVEDIVILSIGVLCLGYWSFNETSGGIDGLTRVEVVKSLLLIIFFTSITRLQKNKIVATANGLGVGLWLFGTTTLTGSLLTQEFQSARGAIYDIFTGSISAGSIYIGYLTSYALLIFFVTQCRMIWPALATTLLLAMHAQNRNCFITGSAILIYYAIDRANQIRIKQKSSKALYLRYVLSGVAVFVIALSFTIENVVAAKILNRFTDLSSDVRLNMNIAGYTLLLQGIIKNNFSDLLNTTAGIQMIFPGSPIDEPGWHSLVLDSTRANGWIGLTTSLVWFTSIIIFTIEAALNNSYRVLLAGILESLALIIIMPVALGSHHLLGSITLTTLIISREFLMRPSDN
jgi:hypothetical protein